MDAPRLSNYGIGDDLFETLPKVMATASRRLWIKVAWWDASQRGRQLAEAAIAACSRGLDVRVLCRPESSLTVRRFTAWLIAEGCLAVDPFAGPQASKSVQPVVEPLTDKQLRALIHACTGPACAGRASSSARRGDRAGACWRPACGPVKSPPSRLVT